jgi:hypothetical protein
MVGIAGAPPTLKMSASAFLPGQPEGEGLMTETKSALEALNKLFAWPYSIYLSIRSKT